MPNSNKNILITGASRGIGACCATFLGEQGYNVFVTARNEKLLKALCQKQGVKDFLSVDLTEEQACEKIYEKFNNVDILINNAGEYIYSPVENMTESDINRLIKINIEIPINFIRLYTKQMKEKKFGRIINIGSIAGVVGEANACVYSATKSALVGLSKSLALELAQDGITVNTINPGFVETDMGHDSIEKSSFEEKEMLDIIPQKRFVQPIEIASLCEYLIKDTAKGITGQSINLCAGLSLG